MRRHCDISSWGLLRQRVYFAGASLLRLEGETAKGSSWNGGLPGFADLVVAAGDTVDHLASGLWADQAEDC